VSRLGWLGALAVVLLAAGPLAAGNAQDPLEAAVEQAASAWTDHRVRDLVAGSDTVRLRIPGVAASAAVRASQAARLLEDFLADAEELQFGLRGIRRVAEDHAYAEFGRGYRVSGTSDVREQTVFFGYRRLAGEWRLREVRIAP
jgi:hypothetical protein